jgi:hypothetical protein
VLQPEIGAVEESATITTCKALVGTYNVNARLSCSGRRSTARSDGVLSMPSGSAV